jgi:hypothetical protein
MPPHVHLEDVRTALREFTNTVFGALRRRLDRVLIDHPIPPAAEGQREQRDDRRTGPQRERRDH